MNLGTVGCADPRLTARARKTQRVSPALPTALGGISHDESGSGWERAYSSRKMRRLPE
jgi:hypothetical protein